MTKSIKRADVIKNIRNHFRLERKNKAFKDKILQQDNSYGPIKTKGVFNNYIEFESNSDRN